MKLSDIKQSKEILFQLLNVQKEGKSKCCFHEEKTPSMDVFQQGSIWFWKCWGGCGSGTCIDAAMKLWNLSSPADAIKAIEKEMGIVIMRDEELQEPIIDPVIAENFINHAHNNLMKNYELREYYTQKRKIFNLSTIINHRLGFVEKQKFPQWKSWEITGWVLPITNSRGQVVAVKIHQEKRLRTQPKCVWAPFGTYPEFNYSKHIKPIHGLQTFWPPPEVYTDKKFIILTAGELKALALIDAGYNATSHTCGENKLPERMMKRLEALHFGKVFVNYDDDSTGKDFRDIMVKELGKLGMLAIPFTYTSKTIDILPKNEPEPVIEKVEEINTDFETLNKEWIYKNLEERIKLTLKDGIIPEDAELFTNQLTLEEKKEWFKNNKL